MAILPDFAAFAHAYDSGTPQVLFTRLIADLETPVSAFLKLGEGRDNAFLLESVQGGEARGRYSIIGLKPDLIWRCRDGKAEINRNARANADAFEPDALADKPLESLRKWLQATQMELPRSLPPGCPPSAAQRAPVRSSPASGRRRPVSVRSEPARSEGRQPWPAGPSEQAQRRRRGPRRPRRGPVHPDP